MCGYIGVSQRHKISYELITSLFACSEIRGIDASGVWATNVGEEVIYHKEPIRSAKFVRGAFWNSIRKIKTDMLLAHSRAASKGAEHAIINANNHPFVSSDRQIGLIHNGCIDEANFLKDKYEMHSDTDSEVLLRIYEHSEDEGRLEGIKNIWSVVSEGAMAVAIGERLSADCKTLFLFRNDKRPLWLADLRNTLGQIFFFSSLDVWYRALSIASKSLKECVENQKLIEVPSREIWNFHIINSELSWQRYEVKIEDTGKSWKHEGEKIKIKSNKSNCQIITELNDGDALSTPAISKVHPFPKVDPLPSVDSGAEVPLVGTQPGLTWTNKSFKNETQIQEAIDRQSFESNEYSDDPSYMYIGDHELICRDILDLVKDIEATVSNSCLEQTMSPLEYQSLIESLEQTKLDLQGTLQIIGR